MTGNIIKPTRLTKIFALAALVISMLLAACGGDNTPTTQPQVQATPTAAQQAATTPQEQPTNADLPTPTTGAAMSDATPTAGAAAGGAGGTLRWANEGVADLDVIDPPGTHSSNDVMVSGLIFEGLVGLDSKLNVRPTGAESMPEISADGTTYTFTIRKGLKWGDGSSVTSEDFRFSLERALSKPFADGSAPYYLSNIEGADKWTKGEGSGLTGVTAPSPDKLVIKIVKPGVYFLDQLTFIASAVVPKKLIDQYGDKWAEHAWGTGPFMVKEWKHNERITLVPNPNYWLGKPQLDMVDIPFIKEAETAFQLFQTGQLDIMGSQQFPPAQTAAVEGKPGTKQVPQFFDAYIGFNNKKAPLDNVHLRRALALAIDKKTMAEKVLAGAVINTDHIVPQGMPGYFDALKPLTFNVDEAKKELGQAGTVGKISLSYTTGQADFDKVAATVQQMWKQNLGLEVQLNGEEQAKFNDDLTAMANDPAKSNLEMYISVWGADYPDPQNFLTQQLHTDVGNNNGHWSDPDFDKLTDQADIERDQAKRMDLYNQAEQIALDKVGWLPLYNGKGTLLLSPNVKGLTYTAQGLMADDWSKVTVK